MPVLIVSSSRDRDGYGPVADLLIAQGIDVAILESDRVFARDQRLKLELTDYGWTLTLDDVSFPLDEISAAWYRKPHFLCVEREDAGRRLSIEREIRDLVDAICDLLPENLWLNAPHRIRNARSKLRQLELAVEYGMAVPDTIVTNCWGDVEALEARSEHGAIVKMTNGTLYSNSGSDMMFTQVLDHDRIGALSQSSAFPAIFQGNVPKSVEWRLTVVGEQTFSVAIRTANDARNDWREHQLTDSVSFEEGTLDTKVVDDCQRMLKAYGLRYGAFDLIEEEDGQVTFLEMNPNGQFGWIDHMLGLGIAGAVSEVLINDARKS